MLRLLATAFPLLALSGADVPYTGHHTLKYPGPIAYADRATETLFYVESDGRHVSAIGFNGKVQWTRDPHQDAHLKEYRVKDPKIVYIGRADPASLPKGVDRKALFVHITFNNTQSGVMDAAKGNFTFYGQD